MAGEMPVIASGCSGVGLQMTGSRLFDPLSLQSALNELGERACAEGNTVEMPRPLTQTSNPANSVR
jgi:hypothetical protein